MKITSNKSKPVKGEVTLRTPYIFSTGKYDTFSYDILTEILVADTFFFFWTLPNV